MPHVRGRFHLLELEKKWQCYTCRMKKQQRMKFRTLSSVTLSRVRLELTAYWPAERQALRRDVVLRILCLCYHPTACYIPPSDNQFYPSDFRLIIPRALVTIISKEIHPR